MRTPVHLLQVLRGHREVKIHELVLHPSGLTDDHHQGALRRHLDQPHLLQGGMLQLGAGKEDQVIGELGHQFDGVLDNQGQLARLPGKERLDLALFISCEIPLAHQPVHVVAVTLLGWNATGRGMGLFDQAHLLQVCHFVADGGRADAETGTCAQLFWS